jgi:hypothetical protein
MPYAPSGDKKTGQITYPEPPPDTLRGCETAPPGSANLKPACQVFPYSSTYGRGTDIFTWAGAEDWANSFGYYIMPNYESASTIGLGPVREAYVKEKINKLR